jgi:hypothetical protein
MAAEALKAVSQGRVSLRFWRPTVFVSQALAAAAFVVLWSLLIVGWIPQWSHVAESIASIVGVQTEFLPTLGLLAFGVAATLALVFRTLDWLGHVVETFERSHNATSTVIDGILAILDGIGKALNQVGTADARTVKLRADLEVIRTQFDSLKSSESQLRAELRTMEKRMTGEWHFVVGLIVTVLLGVVAIFLTIFLAFFKEGPR